MKVVARIPSWADEFSARVGGHEVRASATMPQMRQACHTAHWFLRRRLLHSSSFQP
jgi:hypothetical protein